MCGICGKLYFDEGRTVLSDELRRMADMLMHRGPDDEGVWVGGNVGLAHRRLAIIDLRPEAGQPMCNEDGTVWITFNGEIYNFRDLRSDLEGHGHVFRSNSDTEVIVHAYEQYGRECLQRLRGMFAFAIWDSRSKSLFLGRDRVGKKPLYYFTDGHQFVFASEIKAILADSSVDVRPNITAIDHYLAMGYVPSPLSSFEGVRKLPAGHWLEIKDRRIEMRRYWRLRYTPKRRISFDDAVRELQSQLAQAVRLRLISDVPLGAFLSGGVDSSAIVAYMAQTMNSRVRTFSVGFEDASFDERPFARIIAERFGTNHTELVVSAPVADILPRVVWQYDEPFADPSAVPSYAIAELTRRYVTVVLNGDGGDESFAGYNRYIIDRLFRRSDVFPYQLRRGLARAITWLPGAAQGRGPLRKLAKVAELIALESGRRYARWFGQFSPEERHDLYTDEFQYAAREIDAEGIFVSLFDASDATNCVDANLNTDVNLYLPDDLLVKMDRASMAHSLEARSPLLDHVLMEFVAALPQEMKLFRNCTKHIFKQSLRGIIPDAILDRPKMGFGAPISSWLRNELRDMAVDLLLSARAKQRGYFRPKVVEKLWSEHKSKKADHSETLWSLLVLELWHRIVLENDGLIRPKTQVCIAGM